MDLQSYLKAGYPGFYIETEEPLRAISSIQTPGWQSFSWDCLRGRTDIQTGRTIEDLPDPLGAVKWLGDRNDTVLVVQNFHHFISSVEIIQEIQNSISIWKSCGCCLVMVGPPVTLPPEIAKFFTILDFKLPSLDELRRIQQELAESVDVDIAEDAVEAASGLTEFESETAFALSLVLKKRFCADIVTQQKMQMIRRTGLMEFWPPVPSNQVGGLDLLKTYLSNRKAAFEPGNEHLPRPKALLLVGIPGTGKSLSCKAAASIFGWPLIRLDISSLKGSLVGESERKIRQATSTIEAFGKAVVWLDEIDKVFGGVKSSSNTDGGTTASMFGHFLTWMQETTSPVLVMATANNLKDLPPEFMRAGRFDAMFFVDLPTRKERQEIIQIMNERYHSGIPETCENELSGWTGAEIEQLAKDSLFDGFDEAHQTIVPLSKTMKEEISALQQWAATRARRASLPEDKEKTQSVRRIK
ncbi:ATPase, AAA family [delta proteobacterium NaphS2]|nr:ATPase, AAA family [delta proteobacterium NaphS2]